MTTDPLERVAAALEQAVRERDELRNRADKARLEKQDAQRRLKTLERKYTQVLDRVAEAERRASLAEERAEAHQRAVLDHAGRI